MNSNTPSLSEPTSLLSTEFGDRLVTLCDGRSGLRCALQIQACASPAPSEPTGAHSASSIKQPASTEVTGTHPVSSIEPTPPILEFISSTETLDRYDEILSAGGWRLDNYRRNPVFQNAHQYGDIIFTLGKGLITEVRQINGRPALYQKIEFAVDANPMARIAYGLYKGGFLNAVSVGFIPLRWENGEQRSADASVHESQRIPITFLDSEADDRAGESEARGTSDRKYLLSSGGGEGEQRTRQVVEGLKATPSSTARSSPGALEVLRNEVPRLSSGTCLASELISVRGEGFRRRYLEQELLEVSAVGIPANPDALQLGLKSGVIAKSDIQDLLSVLQHSIAPALQPTIHPIIHHPLSPPAVPNPHACAPGIRNNGAQLLQLARALRNLLRRA